MMNHAFTLLISFALVASASCTASEKQPTASKPKSSAVMTSAAPETPAAAPTPVASNTQEDIESTCLGNMSKIIGRDDRQMKSICKEVKVLEGCRSVEGKPIYHYDRMSPNESGKRILTFALIHGDEGPSGTVARTWMERLSKIDPQNHWRIVPVLNPDGWAKSKRVNARGIDLNRNFPTANWDMESQKRWVVSEDKDPRRFPGAVAASEPETKCAMTHIDNFHPDFIISIHTPFGVLDFDGPRMKFPEYNDLPWFSLGNFPGSMGRYMWIERRVPVLTIELKGNDVAQKLDKFDRLQDVTGVVAIQSEKILKEDKAVKSGDASPKKKALNAENQTPKLAEYTESMGDSSSGRKSSRIR